MFFYKVPQPNEALLIAGRRHGGAEGPGYRIVVGQGAFVVPPFKRAFFLDLSLREAEMDEPCVSTQGIALKVQAVAVFKIGSDAGLIASAAQRFLDQQGQNQMEIQVGRIFAGHLRQIVGQMTVEDIIRERDKLVTAVKESSASECEKLGLIVDSFQIQQIQDPSGYITNLALPHQAAVESAARVAAAQQNQTATQAEQEANAINAENQAKAAQRQAAAQADIEAAQQTASQAGPLAQAKAQQQVIQAQTENQKLEAERNQAQLRATQYAQADAAAYAVTTQATANKAAQIAAAEAEAQAIKIRGEAEAGALQVKAEAVRDNQEALMAQQLIERLPEIVAAAAQPLSKASITILDGAEGFDKVLGGAVAAGLGMLSNLRESLPKVGANGNGHPVTTAATAPPAGRTGGRQ